MFLFPLSQFHLSWSTALVLSLCFLCFIANSDSNQTPCSESDAYHKLNVVLNPDGTLTRLNPRPVSPPSPDPSLPISVLSRDLHVDPSKHTWVRIFLPRNALSSQKKLPLVVFFHGGGFIVLSAGSTMFHDFCFNMADDLGAVVVSVEYRLAPEHRLPAAYDDAMEALHWIRTRPDDWLGHYADYSECYLMGSSAGGNIAYFAGLRAAEQVKHLEPLNIRGLILVQPFFGGMQRTGSELRLMNNERLPLCVTDLLWKLSLPMGVDRDHEYCNPMAGEGPERVEKIRGRGWRVLVTGTGGDPLMDRQKEVVKMMEEKKVKVVGHFTEGGYHGIQDRDLQNAKELYAVVKKFISSCRADE
ncbi:carboxylesterase 1-like [Neltuma alba]|uniref:carboxylesterase 1-like n=1 Tax=Neltuma alba TaxID=207710 RepID=UPI0010A48550|nr:carboxylesterase 1-like [Prosopis alba]